jgi:cobalt-zinc-cadmium efflux system outer membrane protein
MPLRRLLPLTALLLLSGCVYHVREQVDLAACDLTLKPYDLAPPAPAPAQKPAPGVALPGPTDVATAAFLEGQQPVKPGDLLQKRLTIPPDVPGSLTPPIDFKNMTEAQRKEAIQRLYPKLEPLPELPAAAPGPGGKPYTLADLQQMGATYSAAPKQALYDVWMARGNLLQSRAYPNPTLAFEADPSANGITPTFQGISIDQSIKTGGKLKLQEAAARMDLMNAELAVRRARSDLSTQVRNAYFAVLVARESVRVNRAVARLTDEVYRIQVDLLESGQAAAYEPSTLQAQAEIARLALVNSITNYKSAWLQLVAAVGLREHDLPLSELAGRVDANVPRYDRDQVLAHVLSQHTDVLSSFNTIEKAKYNLELARITPWFQDMDVQLKVQHDFSVPPNQVVPSVTIGMPLSIWDQNKGNIIAAESALGRALEQPHAAQQTLTGSVATAFGNYKNNLDALEYYRRILPQLVRAYRGVFDRRAEVGAQGRTPVAFADLVTAQQALTAGVTQYLTVLGQVWTSAVGVADLLQTDDLFQLAQPEALPPIPDLDHLLPLPCEHGCPPHAGAPCAGCVPAPAPVPPAVPVPAPESAKAMPAVLPPVADDDDNWLFPASGPQRGGTQQ